jgi:hypothetical protein
LIIISTDLNNGKIIILQFVHIGWWDV